MAMRAPIISIVVLSAVLVAAHAMAQPPEPGERPLPPGSRIGILFPAGSVMTPNGTVTSDALVKAAVDAMAEALEALSYEVMMPAEVITELSATDLQCERGFYHCPAIDVLHALKLEGVVTTAIWTDRQPASMTIEVTLADAMGHARGSLQGDPRAHVPVLLKAALDDTLQGRAVRLQIDTVPDGAEVRIDGEYVGTSPVTTAERFVPGRHQVTLSKLGYVTTTTHFDVPRGASDPFVQAARMDPVNPNHAALSAVTRNDSQGSKSWDYLLGGTLVALGAVLAVNPVLTIAKSGECDGPIEDGRCDEVGLDTRSGLQLAGSVLALSGGIYIFAATPIAASLSTDGENVHVRVSGTF